MSPDLKGLIDVNTGSFIRSHKVSEGASFIALTVDLTNGLYHFVGDSETVAEHLYQKLRSCFEPCRNCTSTGWVMPETDGEITFQDHIEYCSRIDYETSCTCFISPPCSRCVNYVERCRSCNIIDIY